MRKVKPLLFLLAPTFGNVCKNWQKKGEAVVSGGGKAAAGYQSPSKHMEGTRKQMKTKTKCFYGLYTEG